MAGLRVYQIEILYEHSKECGKFKISENLDDPQSRQSMYPQVLFPMNMRLPLYTICSEYELWPVQHQYFQLNQDRIWYIQIWHPTIKWSKVLRLFSSHPFRCHIVQSINSKIIFILFIRLCIQFIVSTSTSPFHIIQYWTGNFALKAYEHLLC